MFNKKAFYILMFVLSLALIFAFSSIPDLKSSLPSKWDFIFRKMAHFTEFFVLMFFTLRVFAYEELKNRKFDHKVLFCFLILIFYSVSDEFHQSFVADRYFAVKDVLIDIFGGTACYLSLRFLDRKILFNKK